jgi:hypothetical protein
VQQNDETLSFAFDDIGGERLSPWPLGIFTWDLASLDKSFNYFCMAWRKDQLSETDLADTL